MSRTGTPPLRVLRPALRSITETLARELAQPTGRRPDWSDMEWTLARAVAAMHGVSPLLASRLQWQGPPAWTQFLAAQAAHTRRRHVRISQFLQQLDAGARAAGIAAVALKGVELHAMGVYAAGERPMADIDILVRPADAERGAALLRSFGLRETARSWKEREFSPSGDDARTSLGEHADNQVKVELHERICEKLPYRITDVSRCVYPASLPAGLHRYPSSAALMRHLLLHAAGAMVFQSLRLVHLHDLALLAARMTAADWAELCERGGAEPQWWALPPLRLAARYYGAVIPPRVLDLLARDCPALLSRISARRSLTDVSYSHTRIDAFPGIEWSQTAALALRYVATRIRPSAEHVAWRQNAAHAGWIAGSDWAALSQGRRILRWLKRRPARPVSMHAVRAAFAGEP